MELLIWYGEKKKIYQATRRHRGTSDERSHSEKMTPSLIPNPSMSLEKKTRETVKRTVVATGWGRSDERWNIGFLEQEKLFFVIFLRVVASHYVFVETHRMYNRVEP